MPKRTLRLDASPASIAIAARILREGGLVAMPTETVYGLAASALDTAAVDGIFRAKGRPAWDPLIVHIDGLRMLARVTGHLDPAAVRLAQAAWPGPLTLLLPRSPAIPDAVTAGRPLVGVRWTAHPVALALIAAADVPLAAPSANRFGHISPTTADHVLHDLDGHIDAVVDGGSTRIGLESTVLDPCTDPINIYRQGAFAADEVRRLTGRRTTVFSPASSRGNPQSLPSPGVGLRHYAPRTKLRLVASPPELAREASAAPGSTGVLHPTDWPALPGIDLVPWGAWHNTGELARNLYAALRRLDAAGHALILAPLPDLREGDDLRAAVQDRLRKAAMPE